MNHPQFTTLLSLFIKDFIVLSTSMVTVVPDCSPLFTRIDPEIPGLIQVSVHFPNDSDMDDICISLIQKVSENTFNPLLGLAQLIVFTRFRTNLIWTRVQASPQGVGKRVRENKDYSS